MALTDLKIQSIKGTGKPQKVADAEGMYLFVSASGSKAWRFDYGYGGKRFTYTIGKYPQVGLAAARAKRAELKAQLLSGLNPTIEKRTQKILAKSNVADTFGSVADDWYKTKFEKRSESWRIANEGGADKILDYFEGSSCIHTKREFGPSSSTSSWASV
jgi:Arm DNA-binding domain